MKFCSNCGKEITDEAVVCPHCGSATTAPLTVTENRDEISVGLCVLAALIPLFGIIYWATAGRATPRRAKACGITAIISWAVSFVFGFMVGFLGAL
ncbi:MAG: zinc ribbon domain-containing protein [Ruminococcaceae bacterium]|nr:zinc ribbon domain-containing protein [Oscillospiraceae bacterium]